MDLSEKEKLLKEAQASIDSVIPLIRDDFKRNEKVLVQTREDLRYKLDAMSQMTLRSMVNQLSKRVNELKHLQSSPYFFRCDVELRGEDKTIYFSKYTFPEKNIYSWVSPASVMRFEQCGPIKYEVPEVGIKNGTLSRKDQFLIVDGRIRFMATESIGSERELVFQEYLSQRKNAFILPEIVEQMERAQDAVIRAHHKGPFFIAGPAGSGKTTLALHRVAYVVQSPDTAQLFLSEEIIVFVQDGRTREYFSSLLPQLGIEGVNITTFADWAFERLKLDEYTFINRYGADEYEQDEYEHTKYRAVQHRRKERYHDDVYSLLTNTYDSFFSSDQRMLWEKQKKEKVLDRFDLTILLMIYYDTNQKFTIEEIEYYQVSRGKIGKKTKNVLLKYALIVVDEAENYLTEQLQIFKLCIAPASEAIIYVGDLAQQTQLCTIRDWDRIGAQFLKEDRKVVLQKVYRSTKQILEYIKSLGYKVEIPSQLRNGKEVAEQTISSADGAIKYIRNHIQENNETVVGILSKSGEYLKEFKRKFFGYKNLQILTINEAQGVEFDKVFLVGVDEGIFVPGTYSDSELVEERKLVNRDLIYVALTRAMNELHILSSKPLIDVVKGLL